MIRRATIAFLAVLATAGAGPATAEAADGPGPAAAAQTQAKPELAILAANERRGSRVDLQVIGPPGHYVELFEEVGAQRRRLRGAILSAGIRFADGRVLGSVVVRGLTRWRCDRRTRRFLATTHSPDRRALEARAGLRTPSCANRFELGAARSAKPGGRVRLTVIDRFRLGDLRPPVCVQPPGKRSTCRPLRFRKGAGRATRTVRVRQEGHWRFVLRAPGERIRRTTAVGVPPRKVAPRPRRRVLLLGDSMMSQLATPIADRLGRSVDTRSFLRGGSGITDPTFDWFRLAKRRMASLRPRAVAVLLGGADGYDLVGAGGRKVECCTAEWSALYSRKVNRLLRILAPGARRKVVWILNPAMGSREEQELVTAINAGIRAAAPTVKGTLLADLAERLSPGFVFAESIPVGGRMVRVRAEDGIHFTVRGAELAADVVSTALRPIPR